MIKHTTRRHVELSVHKSTSDKSQVRKKGRHLQKCRETGGETPHSTKSVIIKVTQEWTIAMTRGCNINKNSTKEEATLTHADDRRYWRHVIENTEVASDSGIKHPVTFVCFSLFFFNDQRRCLLQVIGNTTTGYTVVYTAFSLQIIIW